MGRNPSAIMDEEFDNDVPLDLPTKPKVKKKMATTNKVKTLQADLKVARADLKEAKALATANKKAVAAMTKEHKAAMKPLQADLRVADRGVVTKQKAVDRLLSKIQTEKDKATKV